MTQPTADLQADVAEILLTEEQIAAKVGELGRRISTDYAGRELTLVLSGSLCDRDIRRERVEAGAFSPGQSGGEHCVPAMGTFANSSG